MNLTSRTTKYPNGVEVTETFDAVSAPYKTAEAVSSDPVEVEPYVLEFEYHGEIRNVLNPKVLNGAYNYRTGSYNVLLGGVELESGQYKNFSLNEIRSAE